MICFLSGCHLGKILWASGRSAAENAPKFANKILLG